MVLVVHKAGDSLSMHKVKCRFLFPGILTLALCFVCFSPGSAQGDSAPLSPASSSILQLLQITPSEQSLDYLSNKKQYQLHTLLTEQRHPKTWNLSQMIKTDSWQGIKDLLSVDLDISRKFTEMASHPEIFEQAAAAVERAILENKKIYIYGCGATGRLAKQVESSFWRPFWIKLQGTVIWDKLKRLFPGIENALIGEMTGGDRALISSLEGFEDLQLIGKLQLIEHNIQAGDVVFAISEGGETSSVIGTILSASELYENSDEAIESAKKHLFFIYNNPDDLVLPFDRSRSVIENKKITKISLFTGPQAITGSTRMQATTSETFAMGIVLEHAICRLFLKYLTHKEMEAIGFDGNMTLSQRLLSFIPVQEAVQSKSREISSLTDLEAEAYARGCFSTYFAKDALITVFTDATERSPTFKLYPLDTIDEQTRKAWIQVWTPAGSLQEAWRIFLRRPFRGLDRALYEEPFKHGIADPYLQQSALASLEKAGSDQQYLYDFSYSANNRQTRGPCENDFGLLILSDEELKHGISHQECCQQWLKQFAEAKAHVGVILVTLQQIRNGSAAFTELNSLAPNALVIPLSINTELDPLGVRQHIALKMMLNTHSTGVMAKLGRVIGNTMANVNPGNLKLVGRATFMIQMHVNDKLSNTAGISYGEANSVLFDAIDYVSRHQTAGQTSEVALSIIRILETIKSRHCVSWEQAEEIWRREGLEAYMEKLILDNCYFL